MPGGGHGRNSKSPPWPELPWSAPGPRSRDDRNRGPGSPDGSAPPDACACPHGLRHPREARQGWAPRAEESRLPSRDRRITTCPPPRTCPHGRLESPWTRRGGPSDGRHARERRQRKVHDTYPQESHPPRIGTHSPTPLLVAPRFRQHVRLALQGVLISSILIRIRVITS